MKLTKVRQQTVKKLQMELAQKLQKKSWFSEREVSIEQESLKLEEEGKRARRSALIKKVKEIEDFLQNLSEAKVAIAQKKVELAQEIRELQGKLEKATVDRKMVEKLEELHYNQRLQKRRKREG